MINSSAEVVLANGRIVKEIKKILNLNLKYILIIIFFTLFNQSILLAQDIKKILINGNDRVSDETVIMFSENTTIPPIHVQKSGYSLNAK